MNNRDGVSQSTTVQSGELRKEVHEWGIRLQFVPPLFSASQKHTVPSSLDTASTFFPPRLDSFGIQSKKHPSVSVLLRLQNKQ